MFVLEVALYSTSEFSMRASGYHHIAYMMNQHNFPIVKLSTLIALAFP